MLALRICRSKACSTSSTAATGSTASRSPQSGREEISSSLMHLDRRSTWLMMSSMFLRTGSASASSASSALERIAARVAQAVGHRRGHFPRATTVSLATSCRCWAASSPDSRQIIQNRPR
ncbi:hypothetical protein ACFSHR_04205 [Azotobacter chroococcum]